MDMIVAKMMSMSSFPSIQKLGGMLPGRGSLQLTDSRTAEVIGSETYKKVRFSAVGK